MTTLTAFLIGLVVGLSVSISILIWNYKDNNSEDPIKPID